MRGPGDHPAELTAFPVPPMNFTARSRTELFQLLALVLVTLAIPLAMPADPVLRTVPFDQEHFDKIARRRPEVVLIGNSMLNTRISKGLFYDLTAPNASYFLAEGGTRSTVWWFMLKNIVGSLKVPPKVVFIFYRDYDFTSPGLRLDGRNLDVARSFMRPEDELLLAEARNTVENTAPWLDFYVPDQMTLDMRRRLSNLAIDTGAIGQGNDGDSNLQENLNNLFNFDNLRADASDAGAAANDIVPDDSRVFSADPADNFLGLFNDFARQRGIRLVFYRVKRRPDAWNRVTQDADLTAYTKAFREWAESQGHALVDETDDPRLLLSMYHDGDHLARAAMDEYTRMFVDRIRPLLPRPPVPVRAP